MMNLIPNMTQAVTADTILMTSTMFHSDLKYPLPSALILFAIATICKERSTINRFDYDEKTRTYPNILNGMPYYNEMGS